MIIGYILDHVLGLVFGLFMIAWSGKHTGLTALLELGLVAFHQCASFFAFSIEVASIVLLVKVDLGVSTSGMGDDTVKITYAVAMLVLLPLVYAVLASPARARDQTNTGDNPTGSEHSSSKPLMLFVLCWALAFYPFYSSMNAAFGPSRISAGENAALSLAQLHTIEDMCFEGLSPITKVEARLMTSFVILTYIPLSAILVGSILWSGIKSNHEGSAVHRKLERLRNRVPSKVKDYGAMTGLAAIPSLAAGHLWTVLRVRQAQKQLMGSLGGDDEDDSWTFGQVAAVTLFSPVLFECWNQFVSHRRRVGEGRAEKEGQDPVAS